MVKYVPYPLLVLFSARKNDFQCGFEEATDKPMTLDFGRSAPKQSKALESSLARALANREPQKQVPDFKWSYLKNDFIYSVPFVGKYR